MSGDFVEITLRLARCDDGHIRWAVRAGDEKPSLFDDGHTALTALANALQAVGPLETWA